MVHTTENHTKPCIHVGSHKLKTIKDIHTSKVQPAPPPPPPPKKHYV